MLLHSLLAFTGVAFVVVLMPGADTVLVLRTSLRYGSRAAIVTAVGVVCGPVIWGALAGLGVALLLSRSAIAFAAVAAAGGLYLVYLAVRSFQSARTYLHSPVDVELGSVSDTDGATKPAASFFFTGLMTNLLNPKIGVFYVSVMPGLFIGQRIDVWLGSLLGLIQSVLGLIFLSGVALLSGLARRYLVQPRSYAIIETICGLCLLGFGAFVLTESVMHLLRS